MDYAYKARCFVVVYLQFIAGIIKGEFVRFHALLIYKFSTIFFLL